MEPLSIRNVIHRVLANICSLQLLRTLRSHQIQSLRSHPGQKPLQILKQSNCSEPLQWLTSTHLTQKPLSRPMQNSPHSLRCSCLLRQMTDDYAIQRLLSRPAQMLLPTILPQDERSSLLRQTHSHLIQKYPSHLLCRALCFLGPPRPHNRTTKKFRNCPT